MHLSELIVRYGIRRDSWQADYQSAIQLDELPDTQSKVETALECLPLAWAPIAPQGTLSQAWQALDSLIVVDGVQRMHMRLLFEHHNQYCYSGLGSAAAGALRLTPGRRLAMREALIQTELRRYLLLSDLPDLPAQQAAIQGVPHPFDSLLIEAVQSEQHSTLGPQYALQQAMRTQEKDLIHTLLQQGLDGTVLVDGPLPRFEQGLGIVGYVKTLHTHYLPTTEQTILARLRCGERSPLFIIDPADRSTVSWYLRLKTPQAFEHPLTGLVRLEVRSLQPFAELEALQALANRLAWALPALTLERHQDPRSPQNLLPIHALEQQLKNRLGHEVLIQRRLDAYLSTLYNPKEFTHV